jgi:KaiC/GvpD/RAD55 family RecA-like ATPase
MAVARIKTGIKGFDEKTKGGIPENSVVLLYGPPKCGKTIFSMQFFDQGLKEEEPGMYITSNNAVPQLRQLLSSFGMPVAEHEKKGIVFYIDLFAIRGGDVKDTEVIKNVAPNATTKLMITVSEGYNYLCPKAMRIRTLFDSLTPLVEADVNVISRFLQTFIAKNRAAGSTTIITYTEGIADQKMETLFKSVVNASVHMDGKGKMTVESMDATPCPIELKYRITDDGIVVS